MTQPIILAIEDSPKTQAIIERIFTALDCQVVIAGSAEEGKAKLDAGLLPNAVILDFVLPNMQGPDLYQILEKDARYKTIPVIPFTSLIKAGPSGHSALTQFLASRENADGLRGDPSQPMVSKEQGDNIESVPGALILSVGHVQIRVHAGFENGDSSQPVKFRGVGLVVKGATRRNWRHRPLGRRPQGRLAELSQTPAQ